MEQYFSPVITVEDLLSLQGQEDVVIIDASNDKDAYQNYKKAHLKNALFLDIETQLAGAHEDASKGGRHPLPEVSAFVKTLGGLGITPDTHVVIYDHAKGANAASRCWWMLKAVGHVKVQVLSGGFERAQREGYPLSEELVEPVVTNYGYSGDWLLPRVDLDVVDKASRDNSYTIIDVREEKRYNGEFEPIDFVAGHIPRAINIPFFVNFDEEGLFKERDVLHQFYKQVFEGHDAEKIIVHCGSGVTACNTILSVYHAGLPVPNLYVGSWSEWSRNDKPIAKEI